MVNNKALHNESKSYNLFKNNVIVQLRKLFEIFSLFILLLSFFTINISAQTPDYSKGGSLLLSNKPNVFDQAQILNEDTESKLNKISKDIKSKYNADVVFVSVETLSDKTATEYADDFFNNNGYGADNDKNGIVFLVSVNERKWAISTNGESIDTFTDIGQKYIMDKVATALKDDDFDLAYLTFGRDVADFYRQAATGSPYDKSNLDLPKTGKDYLYAALVAIIPTVIIMGVLFGQLKSVGSEKKAIAYLDDSDKKLRVVSERYVRTSVTRTKKSDNNSGSSTHSNSSGGRSGGSSGSF
ncbi:TPM domain-containing protein [Peptostreptococcus canis]|uniref:TPM domain-containing protein n=1 Tax=Peptostreptococcus canis TaxID=1159213 RepID=A0ABR6TJI9_9FIRM|nr:TPM domain-containing protein [Peptostreptococcus canis]MBC2575349.1 TPM domain-containing protein [Peptostreptococcus canis]MBP1997468.1 uncharacterized protein [Peptostreptococcus canis]